MSSGDGRVEVLGYEYNYYIVGNSDSPGKKLELDIPEKAIDFFRAWACICRTKQPSEYKRNLRFCSLGQTGTFIGAFVVRDTAVCSVTKVVLEERFYLSVDEVKLDSEDIALTWEEEEFLGITEKA